MNLSEQESGGETMELAEEKEDEVEYQGVAYSKEDIANWFR